jgi:anti-anti-sigma factor
MKNNDIVNGFDAEKDESLKIKLEKVDEVEGCLTLELTGYIDTYNSACFQKRVQKAIDAGFIRLVFLCSSLNYVSSTGIGSFTSFIKAVKPHGGDVVLMGIQPKVYEVFQLLGFSQFFIIKESLDDAISFFQSRSADEPNFPKTITCPACSKSLKVQKQGRFRCSECKALLSLNNQGQVSLG